MNCAPVIAPASTEGNAPAPKPVHGSLHLCFRTTARNGQSLTAVDSLAQKLQTTVDISVGARAQLTTTGATRVYRQRAGYGAAKQERPHISAPARCWSICPIQ
jgi:hypothetical protein